MEKVHLLRSSLLLFLILFEENKIPNNQVPHYLGGL